MDGAVEPIEEPGPVEDQVSGKESRLLNGMSRLACVAGDEFFTEFTGWAREHFDAFVVLVGKYQVRDDERIMVFCHAFEDPNLNLDGYPICGAPCEFVVTEGREILIPEKVAKHYPDDPMFPEHGIEAYWGLPLFDRLGNPIGLVVLCWRDSVNLSSSDQDLMRQLVGRSSLELAQLETIETLGTINQASLVDESNAYFARMAHQLAQSMRVGHAFIAECRDDAANEFRYLAYDRNGNALDDVIGTTTSCEGSPCALLHDQDTVIFTEGLADHFPNNEGLKSFNIEAYIGTVLKSANGQTIGHMAVLSERPLQKRSLEESILHSMAAQVAAELERVRKQRNRDQLDNAIMMRRKMESLGLMAGAIAHDFNNQLVGILGYSEMAEDLLPEDAPARPYLSRIESSALRARESIEQLLNFAGKEIERTRSVLALEDIVEEALQVIPESLNPNLSWTLRADNRPTYLSCDRTQLFQAIVNLILNANEAMAGREGRATIKVAITEPDDSIKQSLVLEQDLPRACALLEIQDEGIGISDENLNRIFDPFFTTKSTGRGLGLTSILGVAKSHNAGLSIHSELGKGTTIRLYFPPAEAPAVIAPESKPLPQADIAGQGPILVVDDEADIRDLLRERLQRMGYTVVIADDCEVACKQMTEEGPFSLAFVDITMPGKNGFETMEALRQFDSQLPIIIMSGFSPETIDQSQQQHRGFTFLKKPFTRREITEALAQALPQTLG